MDEEQIKIFADSLWDYMLEKKLKQYLSDSVCYYIATVTETASGGMIKVQRPYDKEVTLPCGANAEGLAVGDTCTVLVFGDFSNQIVIGDISKLQEKLTFDNAPTDGSRNPVTSNGIFDAISDVNANIAIVENGTTATHNISTGEYVVWQESLYTANANISIGTTLNTSNLTAVTDGGMNDIKVALDGRIPSQTLTLAQYNALSPADKAKDILYCITDDESPENFQPIITATGVLVGNGGGGITAKPVDNTPTAGSSNLVTSGGVRSALTQVSSSLYDGNRNSGVYKNNGVCNIICIGGTWYNTGGGTVIRRNSADGEAWVLPTGFRPINNVTGYDYNSMKTITIDTNGNVLCNTSISSGAALRFTFCYVAAE